MISSLEFLSTWLRARFDSDKGASLVEYALLVALIAIIALVAISFLGEESSKTFQEAGESIQN